jgi:hypothetical protein
VIGHVGRSAQAWNFMLCKGLKPYHLCLDLQGFESAITESRLHHLRTVISTDFTAQPIIGPWSRPCACHAPLNRNCRLLYWAALTVQTARRYPASTGQHRLRYKKAVWSKERRRKLGINCHSLQTLPIKEGFRCCIAIYLRLYHSFCGLTETLKALVVPK